MSEKRRSLHDILARLDRTQLMALCLRIAELDPHVQELMEQETARNTLAPSTSTAQTAPNPAQVPIDEKAIRREIRAIHRGQGGSLDALLSQVRDLAVENNVARALALLEAITDENVAAESFESWEGRDDWEDEPSEFFSQLGPFWAELLLSAALTPEERTSWVAKLEQWRESAGQYGYEGEFDMPIEAARQGWDDPALVRVLRGEGSGPVSPARGVPAWRVGEPDLTSVRLAILERQGRHEEYLNLADAESRFAAYTTLLVRLDRVREAVDYGLAHLTAPVDALTLARALQEIGDTQGAQRIALHGMRLPGPKGGLAPWLREAALAAGDMQQAVTAAMATFEEEPNLPNYLRTKELDEAGWTARRPELLEHMRKHRSTYMLDGPVDVFLHEGLIDDAIAVVEQAAPLRLAERVADAAIFSRPDWVITTAREQAEPLMDAARSKYYAYAAGWLARARDAYRAAERETEWRTYHQALLARHSRKSSLMPLLKAL